jgi:hypothetical protein
MFERDILEENIEKAIKEGATIEEYLDDKPYPSFLSLIFTKSKPLHVVYAYNKIENEYIVITAYYPDKNLWEENYTKRIKK